jgi:mycothiol synthase
MVTIETLKPVDWMPAMEMALAEVPDEERRTHIVHCVSLLNNGLLNPKDILVARNEGGAMIGVQVCAPIAGSSCLFWLPSGTEDAMDELVRAALQACRDRGTKIAQVFTTQEELPLAQPLLRQGFRHITRMHQMRRDLRVLAPFAPNALRWESVRSAGFVKFAEALERTYEGTLDCPELNGRRSIGEIIAGHQNEGKFNPDHWWLAHENNLVIGVVMLVELKDGLNWDLSYIGIAPEHRGKGHGRVLLQFALQQAREQMASWLLLSVDDRNTTAMRLYCSAGFAVMASHEILLYFFD